MSMTKPRCGTTERLPRLARFAALLLTCLGAFLFSAPAFAGTTINSVTLDGSAYSSGNPYYVRPGQVIAVVMNVTKAGNPPWRSSGADFGYGAVWTLGTNCSDYNGGVSPGNGTYNHSFSSTVNPALTDGTILSPFFHTFVNTACGGQGAGDSLTWASAMIIDAVPPTVISILRTDASPTGASSVSWTVTFSEGVSAVDAGDFALVQAGGVSGAFITSVTGSGTTWTVTANTGTGNGTLGLNLADNDTIVDRAGNPLAGASDGSLVGQVYTINRVSNFDAVEAGAARATPIYTKRAGVAFPLDILALNSDNTISTGYTGTASVQLVDASGGDPCGSMPVLQNSGNLAFTAPDAGRKSMNFTYNSAARNVRVRISDASAGVTGCSTDGFAIRPASFTVTSSNANADDTGTSVSATPIIAAGANFALTATALAGYDGTPQIDATKLAAHGGAVQTGSLAGSFGAASALTGIASGAAFTYSEVGYFNFAANGVYDDSFTTVDQPNDCTGDFSNTAVGGKYGCKFGNSAASVYFGRFIPDHFTVAAGTLTNRRLLSCTPDSDFTYAGEQLRVAFTLTARNGAGNQTQNYTTASGFARLNGTAIANFGFGAVDLADATAPVTATALTADLGLVSSSGTWTTGTGSFTADLGLNRAAAPDGPYESFKLGIDPEDDDGVKLDSGSYDLDTSVPTDTDDRALVGTTKIRYGRLRLSNAHGSELLDLPIPIQTQYWNGSLFVTNADDSCTTLGSDNIGLGNYKKNLNSGETAFSSATITFAAGVGTNLKLTKPNLGNSGSVDLVIDLGTTTTPAMCPTWTPVTAPTAGAGMSYLRGAWCGGAYDRDPTARATFGVHRNANEFIYLREMY